MFRSIRLFNRIIHQCFWRKRDELGVDLEIDKQKIEHLASLIRVQLSDDEITSLGEELNGIVNEFNILQEVNTEDVEPTGHIEDLQNVLRSDDAQKTIDVEDVLSNAPQTSNEFIRVKRVIE